MHFPWKYFKVLSRGLDHAPACLFYYILVSRYRDRDVEDEARELVKEVGKGKIIIITLIEQVGSDEKKLWLPGGRGGRRWEPSGAVPQRAPRQQDRLHHWPTVTLRTLQQQPYLLHSREEHPRSASSQGLAPVEESKLVHFISLSVAPVEESKRVPFFLEFHFSNGILPSSLGFHLLF